MDIDKLFKVPRLPTSSKRKMPDNPTPEMLKKMRLDTPLNEDSVDSAMDVEIPESSSAPRRQSRRATVEDGDDKMVDTSFAPGGDADYFVEEDEEGRFYGGGLTSEQKQILSIFESAEGEGTTEDPEGISITSIRRTLLKFERAANKNQDQRSKYPDDPSKFIDSEADLDSALKSLLSLAQSPVLAYPELVRSGSVSLLIGLLSHENADIVIDVVDVIHELTDEDVGNELEDEEEQEEAQVALKTLIEALLENSILELLVDNLSRLNETEESDRQGVFHILGIFENILGFNPDLSLILVSKTKLMNWLLNRVQSKTHDENRGYSAELLSILLQNNAANRQDFGKKDGVEIALNVLSQFRRRDPVDADETEFMENLFDALCSALAEPEVKSFFLASEGVDLMLLMMREKLQSKSRAIKTLDYAMSGPAGTATCANFIEVLGLKTLFATFMGKGSKKSKSNAPAAASEDIPHILGIISSMFSNTPSDSPDRIRLLAKFVENNYEKADKLLEVRENARNRLKVVDAEIAAEKKETIANGGEIESEDEDLFYLRRLEGGLFTLQTVDYILAWVVMEDDGIRGHITQMLERKNQSLKDIISTLQIYRDNLDADTQSNGLATDHAPEGGALSQKEILQHLVDFLHECL
ncbi:Catenin-beta-like protein [Suillus discolor]|uniref:Catenin-beta-like protein n=1 Tax=Suillus discolor TaxID=1912936 RepID=A0A9P7JLU6_9AGAM|nr:Catenin-beta-like protein [Suillus discolor]KAG2086225.1 Catenin-beta-like protein [Suillus discolor]